MGCPPRDEARVGEVDEVGLLAGAQHKHQLLPVDGEVGEEEGRGEYALSDAPSFGDEQQRVLRLRLLRPRLPVSTYPNNQYQTA